MNDEGPFMLQEDQEHARAAAFRLYDHIAPDLRARLPVSADVQHVGATAVDGCLTKGDLDIVVRVPPTDFAQAEAVLATLFQRNSGSIKTDGFAAFEDDLASPHLGVQLVAIGDPLDVFHRFTSALRRRPALVAEYNALKRRFDGVSMSTYRTAKNAFIEHALEAVDPSGADP